MFKVGVNYEFRMLKGGDETLFWGEIESYEHPLIKLKDVDPVHLHVREPDGSTIVDMKTAKGIPGEIINVTSPNFISAVEHVR